MQPFKPFDHKKLEINDSIIKIDIKKKSKLINGDTFLDNIIVKNDNNIKYKINDNIYLLETNCRNRRDYNKEILYYNDSSINNTNNISFNKNKNGIKLHSSLFFKNYKKTSYLLYFYTPAIEQKCLSIKGYSNANVGPLNINFYYNPF